ncbi:cytochrome P450 3A18-like isoform X2 [Centruroides sculpturatus]|uniref:cytochrome P450 3A18-like isoform X2 n=1 Tax=Centruroides sculpturatus TaxID=218467 RepID=UPI000C6E814D|nr:cytochrome P450 3A18-like isoform X2 [Centruroides sculpturatus]
MNLILTILLSVLICIILLWVRRRKRKMTLFQRYGIPGPEPNFFYGNLKEFNKGRDKCIEKWLQQYGKIFGFFLGAKPYLVCADVEVLKCCQIKDKYNFYNKDWVLPDAGFPHDVSRKMLPLLTDQKWRNLRSTLTTCFTTGKIKLMSALMCRPIKIFLSKLDKQEAPFNVVNLCKKLVFDIICTTAFGITTNVQNNQSSKFVESAHAAFLVDSTDILAGITICFPEVEPVCSFIRYKIDTLKYVLNLPCFTVIYETCKKMAISRKKSDQHPHDLLQAIIDAEDENGGEVKKLSDNLVIGNAMMFMAVGYDTTSTTLEWSIYHLARNPHIQEKIREEIKMNVCDDVEIQYSDLCKFQLLNQVISETLRLWPLSFLVSNRVCADDYHCKDFIIPKGSILAVPVQVLQKDPAYWSEPDKFNPYRFSSEKQKPIDSIVYQPFGAGHRICIGQRLAKTILILTLSNLLRSFKLEFCGDDKMEILHTLFMNYPKNGIIIKAHPLNS